MSEKTPACRTCGASIEALPPTWSTCSPECRSAHVRGITLAEELKSEMDSMGWGERQKPARRDGEDRACKFPEAD